MYDPKGNGRDRAVDDVQFLEAEPPDHLKGVVHRFLELRTLSPLAEDYRFHALPDACTYIVFDQCDPNVTGVTRLRASSEELDLGRSFHFFNIRLLPGVWQASRAATSYGLVKEAYVGALPLVAVNKSLMGKEFAVKQTILCSFIEDLIENKLLVANRVTEKIFRHIDDIHSVADMAAISELSPRQLQRVLKKTTGFAPHDFFKVLRLQQSLNGEPSLAYADQSHFIHSFRRATGYTPGQYSKKFDV
ncbi:helix-turn-helix domain-containing protein [Hoeflea poritis]|uniref:AraC family transcriptional regulator n=1 Tax=Hoeflea poritis TaxID=2993659 RepID=A0ABT4VLB6_9HYPH|nr:AraC family transcriptional regulator [Hoeflea poritis]MDA4844950.1 AraC family transcriptional regulator [Hoeflea poritis]